MRLTFFLAPSLPPVRYGEPPEITFDKVMERLELNMAKKNLDKVKVLRQAIDLHNLRRLLLEKPLDPRGNYNEKELDEALLVQAILPDYVFEFLDQFATEEEKARNFAGLLARYYQEEIPNQKGFLRQYLIFERDLRLVLLAYRAKRAGRDISWELQFEDPKDPLVAYILAQKDMERFDPPEEFIPLINSLDSCGKDPQAETEALALFELNKIEEMSGYPLFSIDWILGYVARLLIVERASLLDREKGTKIINHYQKKRIS